jgi:hypothetical protein
MIMRNGQLEDDPNGKSSEGALDFREWFTTHYDRIGRERFSRPPIVTGISNPVPVFAELRSNKVETQIPGLLFAEYGQGRLACIPWDIGGHCSRQSSQGHGGLMADVIDHMLPRGRQLKSNAHPLVEITITSQPHRNRTLIHFVNKENERPCSVPPRLV